MAELKIGVTGCGGRMGRMLIQEVAATEGCVLAAAIERPGHEWVGRDAGEVAGLPRLGITVGDDPIQLFAASDAVIDFTTPAATAINAGLAAQAGAIHVIGTTGLNDDQEEELYLASRHTALVWAPNMSLGVNLLMVLAEKVGRALGPDFDAEIGELHHHGKVDAPSGTALALGRAVAEGRGVEFEDVAVLTREGIVGPRPKGAIGFAVMRGGDVVGDHTVVFAGEGERLELTHRAGNRRIYAKGAVKAARWARGRPPGLYSMRDVLGLSD